jgi:TetR/AcrR family transcriptional regulator, copper-responsive repressor
VVDLKRGRPRTFDRTAALETATRLFWTRGYDAVSIADLTNALGISTPSLYAAFGDKRALFFEAVHHFEDAYGISLDPEQPARAAVHQLLRDAAAAYTDPALPPGCLVISSAVNTTTESAEIATALAKRRNELRLAITRRLRRAVREGELAADTDVTGLAGFFTATIQGMSQRARDGASRRELRAVADTAIRVWPG